MKFLFVFILFVIHFVHAVKVVHYLTSHKPCCTSGRRFFMSTGQLLPKINNVESRSADSPQLERSGQPTKNTEQQHTTAKKTIIESAEVDLAFLCSKLPCLVSDLEHPVCACNHKTGNVVTFQNKCDMLKHNCRYNTDYKPILFQICPWEFKNRRANLENDDI
ncbi:unnamed protein product [Chilo suppressalis]|uniref:Kazal-like domain-containing protein n=1 Tax=Chilo suppressalis TaxID=168631 RepID=A0ABN8B0M8_CHISP|nr:hypothetical protein evm_010480 [Chilo suppressalis]CAH0402410.1 unnamed protein product [Chilo suppressalis]